MTLKQIKDDPRVYSVENVSGDGWSDERIKYELNLQDGYCFNDGTSANRYRTVKEMAEDLAEVEKREDI